MESSESGDRFRDDGSSRPQHPVGFAEGHQSIVPLRQVVEGPHEQHDVAAIVALGESTGIPFLNGSDGVYRLKRRCLARLLKVFRNGIDEMDLVPLPRQPAGVHSGATSEVEHSPRRPR